jgi:hypothetical protein
VLPGTEVITSPHRAIALRASEEGTCKYERSLGSLSSLNKASVGDPRKEHPIDVMDVAVLPATIMDQVFRHGDLGPVENGRLVVATQLRSDRGDDKQQITHLIHIIPDVNIFGALQPRPARSLGRFKKRLPEVPADGIEKVDPRAATGPAPPVIVIISILLLYQDPELLRLLVDRIIIRAL